MVKPNEKLGSSLAALHELQQEGRHVFRAGELSRLNRDRLAKNGFLQPIMKGWLMSTQPGAGPGESTVWFASFWEFCGAYCTHRFGVDWSLSPEQSLLLHAENNIAPAQTVVYSRKGQNNAIALPFRTALFDLKQPQLPPPNQIIVRDGLRLFSPEAALVRVPAPIYRRNPIDVQVVLSSLTDFSILLRILLDGEHSAIAGRLAGALRQINRDEGADEILSAMTSAGYSVRESNPFENELSGFAIQAGAEPPICGRLRALWAGSRDGVLKSLPPSPGLPKSAKTYLAQVDDSYRNDAYHSLSIEGFRVSPDLIERVMAGEWDPLQEADQKNSDALAARGYWQAFQWVKASVSKSLAGQNPGAIVRADHREWYRELFEPCVAAGLIAPSALAGYRNEPVYLRNSRYVPPRWEAVRDAMPTLFELIEAEPEAAVRAVLGHWLFGYIHPYPDGNGRMARFLMNVLLASGGYPWTIIRLDDRSEYMHALDRASIDHDLHPFAEFIAKQMQAP